MCDILILGSMFPSGMEDEIIKKSRASTLQFAANSHLRMIIDGIEENVGAKDTVLNILPIGSYPKRYSDAFIKTFNYSYGLKNNHINVGYCNITLVKQFSKPHRLVRAALKWAKMHENDRFIVLVYTIEPEFLAATIAAYNEGEEWLCQLLDYLHGNYEAMAEFCRRELPEFPIARLEGTYLVWMDCSTLGMSSDALEHALLDDARLWLNAGTMYGAEGEGYMRWNIACPRSVMLDGLSRFLNLVRNR